MTDNRYYSIEKNARIVISLLKENGIRRVIASPGTTNISVVGSMMNDPFFILYSAPDERSAAYMACGMAAETGEPVVISCTGATASRNYLPGLTEAYYRKLPIIALTSSLQIGRSGHLYPQFIDRTEHPKDTVKYSVQIYPINSLEDEWNCVVKVNEALLELKRNGGGPVHINLMTKGEFADFSVKELPKVRLIKRYFRGDMLPAISGKVAVFAGSHMKFSEELTRIIDKFCSVYDAVVFCDHTSGYKGEYRVLYPIVASQQISDEGIDNLDILIHIGEVSGDYYTQGRLRSAKTVWRVNEDGEIRDYFHRLTAVFQMTEMDFFLNAIENKDVKDAKGHLKKCLAIQKDVYERLPDFPFSNIWIASVSHDKLPSYSVIHFGILNSLRAWNYFEIPRSVDSYSNVGGFGIDGGMSTLIGASLSAPRRLFFGVFGDLAFFYDLNSLGNRHVGDNLRIMLVNNGKGTEFRNYTHPGSTFGDRADEYIAAAYHYGNQSKCLISHYAKDLGFDYLKASNKDEYFKACDYFFDSKISRSIIFEVFTNNVDESNALKLLNNILVDKKHQLVNFTEKICGKSCVDIVRKTLKK